MELRQAGSNQTELHLDSGDVVFFSYSTAVAALVEGLGYVRTVQNYSRTTSRHLNQWLDGRQTLPVQPQFFADLLAGTFDRPCSATPVEASQPALDSVGN